MGYRYLALINSSRCGNGCAPELESRLRAAGLQHRLTLGPIELFADRQTPTLRLGGGRVLVGHLFSRDGSPVAEGPHLHSDLCDTQFRKRLIDSFWGDYLLLQMDMRKGSGLAVMREPSGGVPCLYSLQDGSGFITSDFSLASGVGLHEGHIDWDYIVQYLTSSHQKSKRTGLLGVSELLPGWTLKLTCTELTTEQDWSPWEFVAPERRYSDPREAADGVRTAVASTVRAWAEVDRSILVELSGGLDSSIVAACLRNTRARVACCTLVTPVPGADERQYARLVTEALGVELQTRSLGFEHACLSFIPSWSTASPRIGSFQHAVDSVISAAGHDNNIASIFTGAGGDTVFCYLTNAAPAADAFKERGLGAGISAIRDLSALHHATVWTAAALTLKKLMGKRKPPRQPYRAFIAPSLCAGILERHSWLNAPRDALPGDIDRISGLVDTQLYRDMAPCAGGKKWLRMPLLAQPVVEACLNTPSWMWIAGGQNRAVARAAFADLLPADILNRRSKGNFVAYLGGFYRRNRSRIEDFLLSGKMQERHLLNTTALKRFLDRDDLPARDRLFLEVLELCTVENWLRQQTD